MELAEKGFLEKYGVKLIGTTAETIFKAEDRQAFKDTMEKIGEPCAASEVVHNVEDGIAVHKHHRLSGCAPPGVHAWAEAAAVSHTMRPS